MVHGGGDRFTTTRSVGNSFFSRELLSIVNEGDILEVNYKSSNIRVILSSAARQHTLLVTEDCNNKCIFCSQPPKPTGQFYDQVLLALSAFDQQGIFGITGGEPTYFWDDFVLFLKNTFLSNPDKDYHILSHGRVFSDEKKVKEIQGIGASKKVVFGIPLHGDSPELHDKITGVPGSFEETVKGLLNLAFSGFELEIRLVVNRYNYEKIPLIVDLIRAKFRAVNPVIALMQLEPAGWAKNRYDDLFVPADKQKEQLDAVISSCELHKTSLALFNYPLCHLPPIAHKYANKSISDWKNYFPSLCNSCSIKDDCCGFFYSAQGRHLDKPRPYL
ncbi:His-Xaa-Ser system radical SAM maturase HxsC [Oceanicoccus sagamiensis]|uniref:His-Xaa-Ser system radical SAM maturase HxsC n=1 Tax=Oceanicoccus sagamiensis TaxID=716816 RepID=A0A1X9NH01_9GAMM|nr:His-Xaa-Ser system radical SAM maturase HxsC [Oceanicoccus sagamiensis]